MKNYRVAFIILVFSLALTVTAPCEEQSQAGKAPANAAPKAGEAPKATAAQAVPKGVADMTKTELVNGITQTFNYSRNLVGVVPGIEAVKDEKGVVSYVYKDKDGKILKLEELPKETLESIFLKARNEMTRQNTEQTMKQMKEIKRIQDMERQRRALATTTPRRVTTTYKAPSIPKTYQAPKVYTAPSIPKTPTRATTTRATTR